MKRQDRLAKSKANDLLKIVTAERSKAVVTVDPFMVNNKSGKISDYYQLVDNEPRNDVGRYLCRWQLRIGPNGICKKSADSPAGVIEHVMAVHADFGSKGFQCNWVGCARKRSSIFQCKTEFVAHLRQHGENAKHIEKKRIAHASSDESYDGSNDSDQSVSESCDDDDEDEFTPGKAKKRHSKFHKSSSLKAKQPRRASIPPKPVVVPEKPAAATVTPKKNMADSKEVLPMTITYFRFICQWEVPFPTKAAPLQTVTCSRKFTVQDASIDHLQGHHLNKVRTTDGPYKCSWKECAKKDEEFETITELEKHVVVHTEEKIITFARNPATDSVKPVQRVTPTVEKLTPVATPLNKQAEIASSTIPKPKPQKNVPKSGQMSKFLTHNNSDEKVNSKPGKDTALDAFHLGVKPEKEDASGTELDNGAQIPSPRDEKPEIKTEGEFDGFLNRQLVCIQGQSCINSVLQALLTTSLPTIVKKLCSSGHRCYFCRMLSFTQRAIHSSEGKPLKPFELSLYKEEMGITDDEGDPTEYISRLISEIIADEKAQHNSNDTKYRFMIRFQKKTCECSMSYEAYHWALSPAKKNESLFELMGRFEILCEQCNIMTAAQSIQMPDNLIITLERDENTQESNVYYPDEWVSYNTRYFLAAVIADCPRSNRESEAHYYAYCKVFGRWMMYDDDKTTKVSSSDALGDKQVRVLVYVGNELTTTALREALVQARSYSSRRHMDAKVKLEPVDG